MDRNVEMVVAEGGLGINKRIADESVILYVHGIDVNS